MIKKHKLWMFLVALLLLVCHLMPYAYSAEDESKSKREIWSSGSKYNVYNSNEHSKDDDNKFKSGMQSPFAQVFSAIDSLGLKLNGNVKTTVEFWPPDMDKDKFYKARQEDAAFPFTSWFNFKPLVGKSHQEPEISYPVDAPESTSKKSKKIVESFTVKPSEIPIYENINNDNNQYFPITVKSQPQLDELLPYSNDTKYADYENFQRELQNFIAYLASTEDTLIYNNDDAMTDAGPIVFPTIEPTTKRTRKIIHQYITYAPPTASSSSLPRANKKRKLKKKVKTSAAVMQLNRVQQTPPPPPPIPSSSPQPVPIIVSNAFDVVTSSEHTPVFQIDNNSVRYTDIISNLSNLTELSFSTSNDTGNNLYFTESSSMDDNNKNVIYNSKIIVTQTTTPSSFIIKVEPEKVAEKTQDDVLLDIDFKKMDVPLSSTDKEKMEISMKNSSQVMEKVVDDNAPILKLKNVKVSDKIESTSPVTAVVNDENMMNIITSTNQPATTGKIVHRSRFGVRKFNPRKLMEVPESTTSGNIVSSTVKSLTSNKVKKSEKPTGDMMHIRTTTVRYYTPKSRSRHNNNNSSNKSSDNKSSSKITRQSTKSPTTTTIRSKIRRTAAKKPST